MSRSKIYLFTFLITLNCLSGCSDCREQPDKQLEKNDYKEFGKKIEKILENSLEQDMNHLIDSKSLESKYLSKAKRDIPERIKNKFNSKLSEIYAKENFEHGFVKFVRHYQDNDRNYLVFEIFNSIGFDFREYEVKVICDELRIVDWFSFRAGEFYSDVLSWEIKRELEYGQDDVYEDALYVLSDVMNYLYVENDIEGLNELFYEIPKKFWYENPFRGVYLDLAFYYQDLTKEVIEKSVEANPNEKFQTYYWFKYRLYQDDFDVNDKNFRKLQDLVGNSIFLEHVYIHYDDKNNKEYKLVKYDSLLNITPNFLSIYDSKLELYIQYENYKGALGVLELLINNYDFSREDILILLEEYPKFLRFYESQRNT